ncbi:thermonuclease family protein [Pseudomonas sp. CCI3.2]|uniref:thermonuclease family protein n=1 Tax=unclassified Pseudomonas TaxID=196821 RepID=UPI002AC8C9E5|nr:MULTISPECIES: thermonuclease family protein [unclassified Pseudomonas]MEB0076954.1 thermonuclease family protein [Pseudomonas sp. MH10out]MEB0103543.1 thermonuclease family protein [Pseudomonas sp. CCI3.2]MEB0129606.1 thermonuclease family protein [Pseudomonas sp. CCI2.4]MEB0159877.1 thermonuclease family protein [Pseudomonas sp. AH2 (2023)]MEB0165905.1 thermonuclease family protein [Pseudomonas sp. CCC4.4]
MGFSRLLKKASLAGAFFMPAIWLSTAQALCPALNTLPVFAVQRVVDGDTVRLSDGRSVRMIGMNAPETGKKGRAAEPFADAAKRRLQALIDANDGQVSVRVGQDPKDHYGRTLANIFGREGENLEAQLLVEGLGYQVAITPNVALLACQQAAERVARQAGLGVWRVSPVQRVGQINAGGFTLVTGRVADVQRNGGGLWIELEGSLVLRIAPNLLSQFDVAQLLRLKGQTLEARGWVIDRSRRGGQFAGQARWMLPITHPAMLYLPDR